MRVAVVGAGLGGLSAAASVQRYAPGCKIRVYERDAHHHSRPQGYSITLNQRGTTALSRIGIASAVEEHARAPLGFHIMRYDGKTLVKLPPQDKGPGRVISVLRETLRDMLLEQVHDSASVIRWDSKITGYNAVNEGYTLDVNGKSEGPFDIILGADGVRSIIRQQLIGDSLKSLGIVSFSGLSTSLINDPLVASNSNFFLGRSASFFSVVTPDLANVNFSFAFVPSTPLLPTDQEPNLELLTAELEQRLDAQKWYPAIVSILKQEKANNRLRFRHLVDRPPLPTWQTNGVTLLGDAAHPMSPYRGEGGNTAIADGVAFGIALGKSMRGNWRSSLEDYEKTMRLIGNESAANSRRTARFFHAQSWLGTLARDNMLKAAATSTSLAERLKKGKSAF